MLEIISCSRRTDIPAFYYDWLQESLKNKYVMVKNPYNKSTYMVNLAPERVHSICLWSKSFTNVLKNPGYLSLYNLYFQFTITGYSKFLEPNVVDTNEVVKQMEQLAERYSPQQINWRFDPIILSIKGEQSPTPDNFERARLNMFEALCRDISSFGVNRCTISFLCLYKKVEQRMKASKFTYLIPSQQQQIELVSQLVEIADKYGTTIYTCTSPIIEGVPGVKKGHCIDGAYLEELFGKRASHAKDAGQRKGCGCTRSRDIGAYSGQSCGHGCLYCYAR
ncbi:DUF1848 domain-containing protein [Lutispora thermophila]|jgi:hypothetical protein|uniref:DNA repair photolyase n=1 Tax=Lutispora thermophila DSM 19022 TaxID=1122184 RepID=A0A1M6HTG3_9FIRM|nr:DUF1848 domain-containing protein [Lutispora thermophila]NLZ48444.1 DUF1848 domain-containing protein [Clostridiales bacterium]SHJ25495.1 protein of unknown function [Lutispora thermophila DSM 19022]